MARIVHSRSVQYISVQCHGICVLLSDTEIVVPLIVFWCCTG